MKKKLTRREEINVHLSAQLNWEITSAMMPKSYNMTLKHMLIILALMGATTIQWRSWVVIGKNFKISTTFEEYIGQLVIYYDHKRQSLIVYRIWTGPVRLILATLQ